MRDGDRTDPLAVELRDLLLKALAGGSRAVADPPRAAGGAGAHDTLVEAVAAARALAAEVAAARAVQAEVDQRLREFMDLIVALVSFDYARKARISDQNDLFDGMAAGLNMLGEELAASTVSKAYVTNILESMDDAVVVADRDGKVTTANRAAEGLVGRSREDLVGQALDDVFPGIAAAALLDAGGVQGADMVLHSPGGAAATVSFTASVMRTRSEIDGLVCVARDVSEQRRAEEDRRRLRDAMQRQAVLVEELSTPLIPVSRDVVVMPIVGSLDEHRSRRMLEVLLDGIVAKQARVAILDITGVRAIGPDAVHGILRAVRAASLIGSEMLLTGIRPDVARALIELDADLGAGVVTFGALEDGIRHAMRR
jgi:rsbT co-antagonist protein RsbR